MALMTVNAKELRNYPFRRKFDKTFQKLIVMAGVAVLALAITVISAILGLRTIYNKYYQQERIQGEIRIDIQALSKAYLWALSSPDETIRTEQLGKAADKYPDFESNLSEFEKIYSGKEDLSKIRNDLASLQAIGDKISGMFADGSTSEDIFYYFNDQVYPAIDIVATDFKAVSKETTDNVAKVYKTNLIIVSVALLITIFLVILILFYILDMKKKLSAAVAEPADELKAAAAKLAEGNLDIQIVYNAKDELGELAQDLERSTTETAQVIGDISDTLARIAGGDFTHGSENPQYYKGDYVPICEALTNITDSLSEALCNVNESASTVSVSAANMREGASALAEGATDQAAAIEELTASVQTVTEQTQHMADSAQAGGERIVQVQKDMTTGAEKMSLVTVAMENITRASNEIDQIAQAIEDISSQTQLLSLNASIEAARAGEAGRGFAVVAEEISKLSISSTEAAQNTRQLISDALNEIEKGNNVVKETQEAMTKAQESVNDVVTIIQETGEFAEQQAESMKEINGGIEAISNVIQDNTATAEQSSAVSNELSEQSEALTALIGQFSF
ncbi:MAG: HAMP domain-containing protein [Lachnospiraceae bacterium]|jgi:methyl-accepting chemotaxis protein|nr:HAMP domain-containing protein [Lachnospiraceae bacterium]